MSYAGLSESGGGRGYDKDIAGSMEDISQSLRKIIELKESEIQNVRTDSVIDKLQIMQKGEIVFTAKQCNMLNEFIKSLQDIIESNDNFQKSKKLHKLLDNTIQKKHTQLNRLNELSKKVNHGSQSTLGIGEEVRSDKT